MSSILLDRIRISGFRGLKDIEISLSKVTVLTGCNNVGKTTVLKALQLALGNTNFLTQEDFYVSEEGTAEKIIIDIRFIPINENNEQDLEFDEKWEAIFTENLIQYNTTNSTAFVGLRTILEYNAVVSNFSKEYRLLQQWDADIGGIWQDLPTSKISFGRDSIPFFYIEAQRDIVEDTKLRSSFIGKLLSEVSKSYSPEKIREIEEQIKNLNEATIEGSDILKRVQTTLKEIESAIDNDNSEVSITPFTKKLRDLNKGITIHYGNENNSYTMDYHGMGTRSWSSLLTFKSFILQNQKINEDEGIPFFPIITIEEPEAHLHPDAQKRLYAQMAEMPGQKIISTHSPYVAASADLSELRNMYKKDDCVKCGAINKGELDKNEQRALKQKVINTKGEIIFAKAIIFFEGETEEQALPIFAEKYFNCSPIQLGLDFVGVGGSGNYFPFVYLASHFNIPWYIFSDGEEDARKKVLKVYNKIFSTHISDINGCDNIFVIANNGDFEQMLIDEGYLTEIEDSVKLLFNDELYIQNYISRKNGTPSGKIKTQTICDTCGQNIFINGTWDFSGDAGYKKALNEIMSSNKTSIAPIIAEQIINSPRGLPSLVNSLFGKIKGDLNI